ncbi:hypothetical protein [Gramella sp. KN1008]|uniref:hypothetical protein n=1 Tax=Gramella sp. KN1008 TaxID=2529298 RepID=UPI00103F50F8|nr:hypothetical protein [Gramella sp. KN1008]
MIIFLLTSCMSTEEKNRGALISPSSITLKEEQSSLIRPLFHKENNDLKFSKSVLKKEPSSNEYYDRKSKVDSINNLIEISIETSTYVTKTNIELSGSLIGWNNKILVETSKDLAFIAWISEPFSNSNPGPNEMNPNHRFELHLKIIDLPKDEVVFNDMIYSTDCCIDRLSMKYNHINNSILFAYNDFSKPDSEYLMYGFIELADNVPKRKELNPKEIILQDKSEKRWPKFVKNNNDVFLYHTSGDKWSFFEYTGMQQIGISRIDRNNHVTDYRIIADSLPINEELLLIDDTLFYRVENTRRYDEMLIKKIATKDLVQY